MIDRRSVQELKKALLVAGAWVLISVIFLDVSVSRVLDLRSARSYVGPWRYGKVVIWCVVLGFWLWNGLRNWRRFSTEKLGQR